MTELKSVLSKNGFPDIRTYIQSGNLVFTHPSTSRSVLEHSIESVMTSTFGFEVATLLYTLDELSSIQANCPFDDPDRTYFTFCKSNPAIEHIQGLSKFDFHPEEYSPADRVIYFYSPHGYGNAKMNNNFFEKKLKVACTTRNSKTVTRLIQMAQERG